MYIERRRSVKAATEQQLLSCAKPKKRVPYRAIMWVGFASCAGVLAGGGAYVSHLLQERVIAERMIDHLKVGQEVLIEDRDFITGRTLYLEAALEESEQKIETTKDQAGAFLQERQVLQDEGQHLTRNSWAGHADSGEKPSDGDDLEQAVLERDDYILELRNENAKLRVRMYELADAMAKNQATSSPRTAEIELQDKGNS